MHIIAGMHRSGTSMVAGIIYKLGGDFGNKNDLILADKWNPKGYFENKDVVKINNELIFGKIGKFSYLYPPQIKSITRRVRQINRKVETIESKFNDKFVKDNRFCLTLPCWPNNATSLIIVLRNPISIALSLKKRNKIPFILALKIWRYHILRLLYFGRINKKHYVFFENLIDTNKRVYELEKLIKFINKNSNYDLNINLGKELLKSDFILKKEAVFMNEKYYNKNKFKKYTTLWDLIKNKYG
tara:strand:- start:13132 stop:13860 length:729 start_codon:yes stop_codon:yes gene_type:complete